MQKFGALPKKTITMGEARKRLRVSKEKMAKLVADDGGVLDWWAHPLDGRYKLLDEEAVARLTSAPERTPKARAA
jgi:hypothetical protein